MTVHDWEDMRQRLALPREDPARPHVGWHWYVDGLARDADRVLAPAIIALRLFQDPVVLGARGRAAFDA